jgi:hypothetical protein
MTDPRYPIGKFHFDGPPSLDQRTQLIEEIEQAPVALRDAVNGCLRNNSTRRIAKAVGRCAR